MIVGLAVFFVIGGLGISAFVVWKATAVQRAVPAVNAPANFEKACAAARASLGDLCFEDALKLGAEMAVPAAIEAARTV